MMAVFCTCSCCYYRPMSVLLCADAGTEVGPEMIAAQFC